MLYSRRQVKYMYIEEKKNKVNVARKGLLRNLMRSRPDLVTNVGSARVPTLKPHLTGL